MRSAAVGVAQGRCVVHDCDVRGLVEPSVPQILDFCAEEPVERVFLEDVARRGLGQFVAVQKRGKLTALCHVGANVVPSGEGCGGVSHGAPHAVPRGC